MSPSPDTHWRPRRVVSLLQPQVPSSPTLQPGQHILLELIPSSSINENLRGRLSDYSKLFLTSRLEGTNPLTLVHFEDMHT